MGWIKRAVLMMCAWGTTSNASLPPTVLGGELDQRQHITSWMAHLNKHSRGLNVRSYEDLSKDGVREQTLFELQLLEEVLRLERQLPAGELVMLACSNIVCGGKDK